MGACPSFLAEASPRFVETKALEGAARRTRGGVSARTLEKLKRTYDLTEAEERVLRVLALGVSNRDIAERLFIFVETVKTHVQRILRKARATSRAQLVALAR